MKLKLIPIAIFLFLFFLMGSAKSWGFSSRDDYLWIEFGESVRQKDGTLSLPLQVNFGRFPDEKKEISKLDGLKGIFYALAEEEENANEIFYEAEIERGEKGHWINIKSFKAGRFIVLVEASKSQGQITQRYLAKTSFVLFGHSFLKRDKIEPVLPCEINRKLEISTNPRFHYWPQTGNPVKITPLFNQERLGNKVLCIFDENGDSIDIKTDETGGFTYIPAEDEKLNRKGETAFKQVVIVTGQTDGNISYVSSYTLLLHRSRFKNCRLLPGFSIFFGTMLGVFSLAVAQRKRFEF